MMEEYSNKTCSMLAAEVILAKEKLESAEFNLNSYDHSHGNHNIEPDPSCTYCNKRREK